MTPRYPFDHTFVEGDSWNTLDVFGMFLNAVAKRLVACRSPIRLSDLESLFRFSAVSTRDGAFFAPGYEDEGFFVGFAGGTAAGELRSGARKMPLNWPLLQYLVMYLTGNFYDPEADFEGFGGDTYAAQVAPWYEYNTDYEQSYDSALGQWLPQLSFKHPNWPGEKGLTRKRWRWVTSLSSPGEAGERGRLLHRGFLITEGLWQRHDANYPAQEATPADEQEFTRQYVEHDGTSWVISEDQDSPADEITLYGVIRPGDRAGPWIVNEIRDALKLLTRTIEYAPDGNNVDPDGPEGADFYEQNSTGTGDIVPFGAGTYNDGAFYFANDTGRPVSAELRPKVIAPRMGFRKATFYAVIRPVDINLPGRFNAAGSGYSIRDEGYEAPNMPGNLTGGNLRFDQLNKVGESPSTDAAILASTSMLGDASATVTGDQAYKGWLCYQDEEDFSWPGPFFAVVDWQFDDDEDIPDRLPVDADRPLACVKINDTEHVSSRATATITYTINIADNPVDPKYNGTYTQTKSHAEVQQIASVTRFDPVTHQPNGTQQRVTVRNDANTRRANYLAGDKKWADFAITHFAKDTDGKDIRIEVQAASGIGTAFSGAAGTVTATLITAGGSVPVSLGPGSTINVTVDDICPATP